MEKLKNILDEIDIIEKTIKEDIDKKEKLLNQRDKICMEEICEKKLLSKIKWKYEVDCHGAYKYLIVPDTIFMADTPEEKWREEIRSKYLFPRDNIHIFEITENVSLVSWWGDIIICSNDFRKFRSFVKQQNIKIKLDGLKKQIKKLKDSLSDYRKIYSILKNIKF